MNLGLVVLTNMIEHAPAYAQAMSKILIPTFGSLLSTMTPLPPLPPMFSKYLGNYVSNVTGEILTVNTNGAFLIIQGAGFNGALIWKYGTTFRLSPTPGELSPCINVQTNGAYNIINYNLDEKENVVSLVAKGLDFGDYFVKIG